MPTPTLGAAFAALMLKQRNLGPGGMPVTEELATAIFADGRIEVRGVRIPVTGTGARAVRAGQKVAVAWERGRPLVAIAHSARRSGAPTPLPRPTVPLVEELFIATRPDGIVDVYFRDFDQCTPLEVDRFGIVPNTVRWGPGNDRFLILVGLSAYKVMKFDRDPFTAFDAGADVVGALSLERTEDLSTNTTLLATFTIGVGGEPANTQVTPANVGVTGGALISANLDLDGALIATYFVGSLASVAGANPPANFISTLAPYVGQPGVLGLYRYPIVADVTNHVLLLDGFTDFDMFEPIWTQPIDFNSFPRTTTTVYQGSVFDAISRPTTWVPANSFVIGTPPTTTTVTWWFGFSETPSTVEVRLEPILVLGTDVDTAHRVQGFVAWMRLEYLHALGQVNVDQDGNPVASFIAPVTPSQFPVAPALPFPITPQTGAIAAAPTTAAQQELYAVQRPAVGLSLAPTYSRVVWRKAGTVQFFPSNNGLNAGGSDSPGFSTLFGGAPEQITALLRAAFGRHGINVVPTDYAYQLDNPSTPLAADAEVNYFVAVWVFGGELAGADIDGGDYPEDTALSDLKALADVPEGVVQPTGPDQYALQVVNDAASLGDAGEFEELPA